MKDAQKPDHVSLNTLVGRLREGRFVIPDFQREFEWKPSDISDLMRSIFSDYYIGSLLLWKAKSENIEALSCESIYGFEGTSRAEHIVLDGQQRLTAMHYAFFAPDKELPNRSNRYYYYIRVNRFMNDEVDKAFEYDWTNRFRKLLDNPEQQYAEHIFPLNVVGKAGWALSTWAQGYVEYWSKKKSAAEAQEDEKARKIATVNHENAEEFSEHLRGIVEQYQISYVELDQQLEIEKVCDIFTKLNSTGVQLDTFDLINALLKPKGLQLKQMWREAAVSLDFVETDRMNTYILQVMSILRQFYCSPKYLYFLLPGVEKPIRDPDGTRRKEILISDTTDFKARWDAAVGALVNAIKLLRHPQEFGVVSSKYLPYVSILPAFSALQWHIKSLPANRQLDSQRKLRHWYWASVFMNRYSGSVESTAARDFLDMKDWFDNDSLQPGPIKELEERFKSIDLRKENKRGTSIYNGIFNLYVIQGAKDWVTGNKPQHDDLDDHHIVPVAKVSELGLENPHLINSVLNRTPLTSDTNRNVIKDRWPFEYIAYLTEENGEEQVRAVFESHFISGAAFEVLRRNPFTKSDFEEFLSERNRTILEGIENLLIKERLDLSPALRELDQRVEGVELTIRRLITETLEHKANLIPSHVTQKIQTRIDSAVKRNPGVDREAFDELERQLEYADLRELQDIITNATLWNRFQEKFLNKDSLNKKIDQLAELRNGIRHSRTVTEIARHEGEAAVLWFEQTL
jgi:hypothetical protein